MQTGASISQKSQYTVPNGKTGLILRADFNAAKISGGGNPLVEFSGKVRNSVANSPWIRVFNKLIDTAVTDELDVIQPVGPILNGQMDIRVEVETDTNNTEVSSRMFIVLVDD